MGDEGSGNTIDRMQVVFSTNLEELIAGISTAENLLESVSDSFERAETASQTWAASMGQTGTAAAASSDGFAALVANIDGISGISEAGTAAVTAYADSLLETQAAVTTANYQMEQAVGRFGEPNTAATNTATAIGRINNISNNAYTTFSRLSTTSGVTAKSLTKLSSETKTLSSAYTAAATDSDLFTKSVSATGTAAATVTTQINEYSKAISTAGDEAGEAAEELDGVTQKTGETEGAMSKLGSVAGKVFAGLSVGTLLSTLDTIIERAEKVSETFQNLESDVTASLGTVSPEVTKEINSIVADLLGSVPATQNDSLGSGAALLNKELPELPTKEFQSLLQEYASYADLWGMGLTDLISSTQKLFYKYDITTPTQMKEALGKINAVYNKVPDVTPSETISLLNNNRQAIGAQGWSFDDALSRTYNAGRDHAMSKFEEYLSALQNVKATKGRMFDSDEAFAEWIRTVTDEVRNATDETNGQQIIQTEFDIWGRSAQEITKYLRLEGTGVDRTDEILAQLEKNGTGYQMYLKQETSSETIARANSQTAASEKTVGDGVLDLKAQVALQNAYTKDLYDVVSIHLGDLTTYIDKIPVVGEVVSPITDMIKDYVPEINIKTGMRGTAEEFIDKYEFRQESGDYVPFIDETYYLAYRKLADKLQVYYDDLQFSGEDAASVRQDLADGLYADLMLRVKAARSDEEVQTLAEVTAGASGTAGIHIDQAIFTGTVQLPDGVMDGSVSDGESVLDSVGRFFSSLSPIGVASAADDMVPIPELAGVLPDTATVQGDLAATAEGDVQITAGQVTVVSAEMTAAEPAVKEILGEPVVNVYPEISVTPELPETKVTVEPEIAVNPDLSIEPQVTVEPAVTIYPEVSCVVKPAVYPQITVEPEITVNPELSIEPQVTVEPAVTVYPEVSCVVDPAVYPQVTVEPEIAVNPELLIEPQVTVEPEVTVYPEVSCVVEPAVYPQVAVEPEITVNPELSIDPQVTVEPAVTVYPEISCVVEPAVYPQVTVDPAISVEPAVTVMPEIEVYPQVTVEPQITLQVPDLPTAAPDTVLPAAVPDIFPEWELRSANLSVPEIRMPQMHAEASAPEMQDGGYDAELQTLSDSLTELLTLARMIAGKDTSNTITNRAEITQNFYAPTVDSYSVKNAASLAVSAAQAKACRM